MALIHSSFVYKRSILLFKGTGMFPYNAKIFSKDDFMTATVTDSVIDGTIKFRLNFLHIRPSKFDDVSSTLLLHIKHFLKTKHLKKCL